MIVLNKGKIILFTFIISIFILLTKKRKYTLTIFLHFLIVLGTSFAGYADIAPVSERTPQVRDAIVAAVPGVDAAADVTEVHLAAITSLNLRGKGISALKTSDFSGLTALTSLNLYNNQLSSLPDGIFEVLTSLTTIRLGRNTVDPLPITVALEKMAEDQFKAIAPTGAPFNIVLPITVKNGRATGGVTTLTIPHGSVESNTLTVARTAGTTAHVAVDIGTLPSLPRFNHYGYALVKSDNLPLIIIRGANTAPVFSDGTTAIRSVAENTARGVNIGATVSATDADNDILTYTLSGTDAASFGIDSTSGQLQTKAALDYETKTSYSVAVSVSDGYGGSDSIAVTINVTDVHENRAPVFTDGANTTRTIAENTASGQHIGTAVTATDADGNTLAYTLSGTDAASFGIDRTTGQLKTKAPLDYETKTAYTVTVTVSDGTLADTITVTINVTDMDENRAPVFTDGNSATRTVAENTTAGTNIGNAITATDLDNDTLIYTLGGTDASSFSIVSTSGQLQTRAALDYETKASYSITISVSDGSLTDIITVTINITDVTENIAPVFTEGNSTTRSVAENTVAGTHIGTAVSATDANNDTLIYTLSGTDASAFSIDSATGRLQTKGALDYETKKTYTVTITVSDGKLTDTINVTINITDIDETIPNRAPVFTEGSTTTRAVAENTASGQHIGTAVAATDADGNTLAYTLSGTDAASFGIDRTTGQLKTKAPLDYETKTSYTVTVTVSDGTLTDTITVTINVTDVNETPTNNAPVFTEGTSATRSIAENTASGQHIGTAVAAT
ncbi:MAG: cadherin domain-containing protein, partial [Candidatus Poribacteria bacterium]|nr:cadherin domain-containing protein [Candidatus Poribacteria bacterium]